MKMKFSFLGTIVLLVTLMFVRPSARAQQNAPFSKLDSLFELLETKNKFMGTVAVSKDGKIVFQKQYGKISKDEKFGKHPDAETQYRIGSITKIFTAVMIMQLVEKDKLSLDDKLSKFFPKVANADQISIRQMLGHQSGIGSITSDPTYMAWNKDPKTREQMMEVIARQPKSFEPGEKTEYSNSNFVLLGYIIEQLTGSTYAEQLQIRICDRIGLQCTSYMTKADAVKNVAISFRWTGDEWQVHDETDPSIPHGAGSIMSTPSDLTRFAEALFDGKLVSGASLKEMTPGGLGMGRGLIAFPFGTKRALGHNGGIDGFQSNLGHFEEDGVSVALIGNGVNYGFNDIMIGMLSIVFDRPYEMPDFTEVKVPEKVLKRYAGTYASDKIPLKITITVDDGNLVAQGSGQPSFPLGASSETEFRSNVVGAVLIFSESSKDSGFDSMLLKQAGQKLEFRKE